MKTDAILFTAPQEVQLAPVEIPLPSAGEILIETLYTLISPGTELRCLKGKQEGVVFPFIPGYSLVGRVVGRGVGATMSDGTVVFCSGTSRASANLAWGGHTGHAVQAEVNVYPVPGELSHVHAAAAKLTAIAYRGVRLSQPKAHETVAVVGLGAIGLLAAQLYALSGARVVAADLSAYRVARAQQIGLVAFTPSTDSLGESFARYLPDGADIVVDATGVPEVLPQTIALAKDKPWDDSFDHGARLVIQGSYAEDICLPYMTAFMKELSIYVPRDVQPRDLRAVLDIMGRGKLNLESVITRICSPTDAPTAYADLAAPGAELITAAFEWAAE